MSQPLKPRVRRIGGTIFLNLLLFVSNSLFAQNAIVTENAIQGVPSSQWDIPNNGNGTYGDSSIQGFSTDISVNKGQTIRFKISVSTGTDKQYGIRIYRIGYYQGNGARLVADLGTAFTGIKQDACGFDNTTGLIDCGNWTESVSWAVPSTAVSGLYVAKLTRSTAGGGGSNHIAFIVRDDASTSDIIYKTSDATWEAYNPYGGYSLYVGPGMPYHHASKVSYNRPFQTRNGGGGGGSAEDWFMNAEYPMIRFLERNGYDISYTTCLDIAKNNANNVNLLLNHSIFLSVGHDEYWSKEERNSVEAARAAGKHLAFFSGNECYWKTRWENSADGTNTPFRTLVCYKEGTLATSGENPCGGKCDPSTEWTGLWRDGCSYPSGNACKPENALSGEISWDGYTSTMQVPDTYKNLRFWRNTSITSLGAGQTATLTAGTLGYEWDWEQYQSSLPPGRITMSSTSYDGHIHKLSFYKATSGSRVFGAGVVQWAWGLDATHDRGSAAADPRMQQATVNLFADMGVQPVTLMSGLVIASASTDLTPPSTTITSPADGSSTTSISSVTITGTATDANTVAAVEISFDGGATWTQANGTTSWSYVWTPPGNANYTIKVRGVDDSGNYLPWSSATQISYTVNASSNCPCTVFGTTAPSASAKRDNTTGIIVGMKFTSSLNGTITGIRFFKASGNSGTHTGLLYNTAGVLLAQAVFTGETATGWQQVAFTTPVSVTAGQTYVAAYASSAGYYCSTAGYFVNAVSNGPLTALANGTDGDNGVYIYSATPAYPVNSYQQSNYWVDLIFNTSSTSTVVANAGASQTITLPASSVTLDGSASTGTISNYSWTQIAGPNAAVIATPSTVTTSVTGLIQGVYTFQLSVNGGASTAQVSVTVLAATTTTNTTIFTTQLPATTVSNDKKPIELGVKFRSSVSGTVIGVRFYKSTGNSGTHTGELYTSSGTRLAQAVFSGETSTGWQTVIFAAPVTIAANTTYIAAYFSSTGYYTRDLSYFTSAVTNGSLTALADGTNGANGVYSYTTGSPAFPASDNGKATNYWVDVIFGSSSAVTANAGSNQTITLPTATVALDGSGSTGTITSYLWTQVSGPNTAAITSPNTVTTTVTGLIQGSYVFQLSLNNGASTSQVKVDVVTAPVTMTIFTTQLPGSPSKNDGRALELGVKFRSSVSGSVNGIRFYKTTGNTGTHVGELYTSTGTRLAQATFTGETASGWQQVMFSTPVSISANTTYIAAYFSSAGYYTSTMNYFTTALVDSPLTALADGTEGVNGVYVYTGVPAFPFNSYQKSNYWVDVVFSASQLQTANTSLRGANFMQSPDPATSQLSDWLGQNYPNPFSQRTKINFSLAAKSRVELSLYDMQGRLVKVMLNEIKERGNYVYEMNTANLGRGIYYYRMRSANYVATKKLMIQ